MALKFICGDALQILRQCKSEVIQTCITSPPYWGLRNYNIDGQIGLESNYREYVAKLVEIFNEVRRVLRADGTLWLNLGDGYAGSGKDGNPGHSEHIKQKTNFGSLSVRNLRGDLGDLKPKDLIGIPWRVAFALQESGWYLRSAIIWAKPNGMPGSQLDRCTSSYETIFMLSKEAKYWSDFDAIKTPPRESTLIRTAQNLQAQAGSHRANAGAKTNGSMRAVGCFAVVDKQRGHSRRHAGFNARWDAMEEKGQQARPAMMRDVWFIAPKGFKEAHFAVFPEELARRCILAGSPENSVVIDPFAGSGTVGVVASKLNRHAILIDLNPTYIEMAKRRCGLASPLLQAAE